TSAAANRSTPSVICAAVCPAELAPRNRFSEVVGAVRRHLAFRCPAAPGIESVDYLEPGITINALRAIQHLKRLVRRDPPNNPGTEAGGFAQVERQQVVLAAHPAKDSGVQVAFERIRAAGDDRRRWGAGSRWQTDKGRFFVG